MPSKATRREATEEAIPLQCPRSFATEPRYLVPADEHRPRLAIPRRTTRLKQRRKVRLEPVNFPFDPSKARLALAIVPNVNHLAKS
jgi:hypothetical protein